MKTKKATEVFTLAALRKDFGSFSRTALNCIILGENGPQARTSFLAIRVDQGFGWGKHFLVATCELSSDNLMTHKTWNVKRNRTRGVDLSQPVPDQEPVLGPLLVEQVERFRALAGLELADPFPVLVIQLVACLVAVAVE